MERLTLTPIKLQKVLQKKMLTLQLSVSNIILRTDNSKLNAKRCKVNQILSELYHGKMIYYKNFQKPTCIALIFTNMPQSFQSYVCDKKKVVWLSSDGGSVRDLQLPKSRS